jgi:transposase
MKKQTLEETTQRDPGAVIFSAGASEGARRATGEAPAEKIAPNPEVVAIARRRQFSPSYKRSIVHEADACNTPGAIGALLRREGLYSSHLNLWRKEVAAELAALKNKPRGPKPDAGKAIDRRVNALELECEKLRRKLDRAEKIMDAQKKLCDLLGLPMAGEVLQ